MNTTFDFKAHYFVLMRPTHNFLGFCSFTDSSDAEHYIECKLKEYDFDGFNYKLYAVPVDESVPYSKARYYTSDFISMVEDGIFVKKETETSHVEVVDFYEPIGGIAYVHHQGEVIVE